MIQDLTHPADLPDEEVRRRLVLERRVIVDRGRAVARADGSYLRVSASASLVDGAEGAEACLLWHLTDAPRNSHERRRRGAGGPARPARVRGAVRHQLLRCRRYGEQAALVRCELHGLGACARARARDGRPAGGRESLTSCAGGCAGPTSLPTWATTRSPCCSRTPTWTTRPTTTADAIREAAESHRRGATIRGPARTDATVGVASLAGAGSRGPGVRRRRAGHAGAPGRRGHGPLRAPETADSRRRLGGELARFLGGLEPGLGVRGAQLVAARACGSRPSARGRPSARAQSLRRAARQQRRSGDRSCGWSAAPTRRRCRARAPRRWHRRHRRARGGGTRARPRCPAPSSVLTRYGMT